MLESKLQDSSIQSEINWLIRIFEIFYAYGIILGKLLFSLVLAVLIVSNNNSNNNLAISKDCIISRKISRLRRFFLYKICYFLFLFLLTYF